MKYTGITPIILFTLALNCNSDKIKIGPAFELGETPDSIETVKATADPFYKGLTAVATDLPGHDDVIFDDAQNAYASAMDGWIWKIDLNAGTAEQWVRPPVNPAGMRFASAQKDSILVCASRLGGESYTEDQAVGLYEVQTEDGSIRPLVTRLPIVSSEPLEHVYSPTERPQMALDALNQTNSRPFALCNDMAVSADGLRVYITEPFERPDAAMGSGAVPEAIGLFPHGRLWMLDRKKETISLILTGFTFVDGILVEQAMNGPEESVIFSETTKFRLIRAFIDGQEAGTSQVLFADLPGLADGLDRDEQGRIWVGILKRRSALINFVHRHPGLKPVLLAIPQSILPVSADTGILVLDEKAERPLYYLMHDGSKIRDISVAVPHAGRVYLPSFDKKSRGLLSVSIADLPIPGY